MPLGFLSAAATLTNCRLRQIEKSAKPLDPLLEQLAAMHENQCIDAALCDQPRSNDGFSESGRGGQDAGVVGQHRCRRGQLIWTQFSVELTPSGRPE